MTKKSILNFQIENGEERAYIGRLILATRSMIRTLKANDQPMIIKNMTSLQSSNDQSTSHSCDLRRVFMQI